MAVRYARVSLRRIAVPFALKWLCRNNATDGDGEKAKIIVSMCVQHSIRSITLHPFDLPTFPDLPSMRMIFISTYVCACYTNCVRASVRRIQTMVDGSMVGNILCVVMFNGAGCIAANNAHDSLCPNAAMRIQRRKNEMSGNESSK